MEPIRIDGDVAIFTTDQLDVYGMPDETKFPKYYVIESPPEMLMSFKHYEQVQLKTIHRYDRDARFKACLRNLMGDTRAKIHPAIIPVLQAYMPKNSTKPYEDCRRIFSHYKVPQNLIPTCLIKIGYPPILPKTKQLDTVLRKVFLQYKCFESRFFEMTGYERKYFPNMKYVALKLLEMNGIENPAIPKLRTRRKLKYMDKVFKELEPILLSI